MTHAEFQREMKRLADQFPGAYGTERVALFWREVEQLPAAWWKRAVDQFIGESRYAPLLPELRESAARERERLREREKKQSTREAEVFWTECPEDVRKFLDRLKREIKAGGA